jgi:hypothetical protein
MYSQAEEKSLIYKKSLGDSYKTKQFHFFHFDQTESPYSLIKGRRRRKDEREG